ncbi:chloramphenicol acetyltransferase [bacterium]|nr:chloramphenicol acetyltransferase [bacterium]
MVNEYKVLDLEKYYRKGVYKHFTKDCKCSVSITHKLDVTELVKKSKETKTKFYVNILYCLARALNSRDDYKMVYKWQTNEVLVYNKINVTHYVFDEVSETCTPVYTEYKEDYNKFYDSCVKDIEKAKQVGGYMLDSENHINYFDASYISWISYESLNIELPDGHLYYQPIINWGRYKEENGKYLIPITVRLNHAIADGYLVSKVFTTLEEEIKKFNNAK